MSQQPNSLVNGPYTEFNATLKDEFINKDMVRSFRKCLLLVEDSFDFITS